LIPIACDISSKESLQAAVSSIEAQTPFINLLIANSGYLGQVTNMVPRPAEQIVSELQKELWNKTTYEDASKVVSTNIAGSYFTFLAFMGLLGAGNTHPDSLGKNGLLQSQFISTTSVGGLYRAEAPSYVYSASKAAVNHLTKTFSSEYAKHGIRANAIAPGTFVTEMTKVCDCKIGFFERVVQADVAIGSHSGRRQQRGWFFAVASHSCYTNRHR
jgi:NAD(P)-dependent dehydrogenase (short-subunit alcohol dehydrogenase family)